MALACTLSTPARADDYTDVGQLIRAGKLVEAQTKADAYLVEKPRDPQMRFLKGVIQTEAGKTDDAIVTLNALTQEYPELPEPYNNLAALYAGQNQYDKARTALEMAIRINPNYATAHENLGDVYAKLASQSYSKALQLDASNKLAGQKVVLLKEVLTPPAKPSKAAAKPAAAASK
jgi:predicted Zn-dependent protease